MMDQLPALQQLIHELCRLPGVGPKTAQRLALYILRAPEEYSDKLQAALKYVKASIHLCSSCFAYTDQEDLCQICANPQRTNGLICVVEEATDIISIESSGAFRGKYHVLQGAISPLDGIHPENLRIKELMDKIKAQIDEENRVKEVILALDADLEGDTTAVYLAKLLTPHRVKVTRIAHGVPIGSDIDFIDHRTLGRALENRVEL